jgi:RNA polymerase sigma-70 factor (ECF subfamily)
VTTEAPRKYLDLLDHEPALRLGHGAPGPVSLARLRQNGQVEHTEPIVSNPEVPDPPRDLADFYIELRSSLLAFLRKHTGDAQVAEDLLHDVVLKALAATSDPTDAPRNLTGWVYAVARNAAMDHHRRSRPTEELPEELAAPEADDDETTTRKLASCLRPMAERLPDAYRGTLIAAEFDGLALAEVARQQGVSLSAVKTRASRGRRLLQQELVKCCRVALSAHGQVLDYDARKASECAPSPTGGHSRGRAH